MHRSYFIYLVGCFLLISCSSNPTYKSNGAVSNTELKNADQMSYQDLTTNLTRGFKPSSDTEVAIMLYTAPVIDLFYKERYAQYHGDLTPEIKDLKKKEITARVENYSCFIFSHNSYIKSYYPEKWKAIVVDGNGEITPVWFSKHFPEACTTKRANLDAGIMLVIQTQDDTGLLANGVNIVKWEKEAGQNFNPKDEKKQNGQGISAVEKWKNILKNSPAPTSPELNYLDNADKFGVIKNSLAAKKIKFIEKSFPINQNYTYTDLKDLGIFNFTLAVNQGSDCWVDYYDHMLKLGIYNIDEELNAIAKHPEKMKSVISCIPVAEYIFNTTSWPEIRSAIIASVNNFINLELQYNGAHLENDNFLRAFKFLNSSYQYLSKQCESGVEADCVTSEVITSNIPTFKKWLTQYKRLREIQYLDKIEGYSKKVKLTI